MIIRNWEFIFLSLRRGKTHSIKGLSKYAGAEPVFRDDRSAKFFCVFQFKREGVDAATLANAIVFYDSTSFPPQTLSEKSTADLEPETILIASVNTLLQNTLFSRIRISPLKIEASSVNMISMFFEKQVALS